MSVRASMLTAIFLAGSVTLALAQAVPEGEGAATGKPGHKSGTSETGAAPSQPSSGAGGAMGAKTGTSDQSTGTVVGPNTGQNRRGGADR